MSTHLIAALTQERVIGKNKKLPWNIPADLKHFKQLTNGQAVIMGRHTWESLPEKFKPLPGRENIVVSSTLNQARGATIYKTLTEAIEKTNGKEAFIIGGAQLYQSALPLISEMHLSWVKENYPGDTYFPKFNENEWKVVEEKDFGKFVYKKYIRIN